RRTVTPGGRFQQKSMSKANEVYCVTDVDERRVEIGLADMVEGRGRSAIGRRVRRVGRCGPGKTESRGRPAIRKRRCDDAVEVLRVFGVGGCDGEQDWKCGGHRRVSRCGRQKTKRHDIAPNPTFPTRALYEVCRARRIGKNGQNENSNAA